MRPRRMRPRWQLNLIMAGVGLWLTGCLPAPTGPLPRHLRAVPGATWTPEALLTRSEVPAERVLPLPEALRQAPLGSVLVACQEPGSPWSDCTHMTRKLTADTLTEETGALGTGARQRPLSSLLGRDLVLVFGTGVQPEQLAALGEAAERLRGAPYLVNGELNAFDCVTYQNALQRALGLPDVAAMNTAWGIHLPIMALSMPTNTLLLVGVSSAAPLLPALTAPPAVAASSRPPR